jgi:uncharacterized protein (DUF302 family)
MEDYGRRIVVDAPFNWAVNEVSEAFRAEGFDLLPSIDVREYLARTAHHECRLYRLFPAYLPQVILEALQHDPETGPMLPTMIAVFELADGETAVVVSPSFQGLATDFGWRAAQPQLAKLADRAGEQVARALDRVRDLAEHAAGRRRLSA